MRIIAVANQKGGCGKTTTAINLSACLAKRDRKVLLIDMDPQGHSTLGYNIKTEEIGLSIYHVLREGLLLDDITLNTEVQNVSLAPANIVLFTIEQDIAFFSEKESRLQNAIGKLKKKFDYIIIDCPPNLGLLSINALRSADEVIIPLDSSFFSLHGLSRMLETIEMLRRHTGHNIETFILPTMFDRRSRFAKEVLDEIKNHFNGIIFSTPVRQCSKLRESSSFGVPISMYAPNSIGHWDYAAMADEVLMQEGPDMHKTPVAVMESLTHLKPDAAARQVPAANRFIFVYKDPSAADVKIAGDFNNWIPDKGVVTTREKDGTWKKVIEVPPGAYQYKFCIDGDWKEDPGNPNVVSNKFGSNNSLIIIN
ncbi:MAG: AAA family ATPase [Nitrospirae bacterium]|nr:AAA family ATPase [Nitrospirota bacterium]